MKKQKLLYWLTLLLMLSLESSFQLGASNKKWEKNEDSEIIFPLKMKSFSPIFPGEVTTINITLENNWNLIKYKFSWWQSELSSRGCIVTFKKEIILNISSTASGTGLKSIFVNVSFEELPNMWTLIAKNETSIVFTDSLSCNIIAYKTSKESPSETFDLGKVNFLADVHNPENYIKNLTFSWTFHDNIESEQGDKFISHVYKDESIFNVGVLVHGYSINGHKYTGECNTTINIEAKLHIELLAWQENKKSYPRLPSLVESFATGVVHFQVHVNDTYDFFTAANLTFIFDFGHERSTLKTNKTTHSYTQGMYSVVVFVKARVSRKSYHAETHIKLSVDRPIQHLFVFGENFVKTGQMTPFKVKCHGSNPVSFCWYVTYSSCDLPKDLMCSPTLINDNCEVTFNYTFDDSGVYCLNVSAINTVGFNTVLHRVDVAGKPKQSHGITILATTLPILAICLLVTSIFVAIKCSHKRTKKRKETEEAQFDFRVTRSSTGSSSSIFPWKKLSLPFISCSKMCFSRQCSDETYTDSDEESPLFSPYQEDAQTHFRPQKNRKKSYYGTVHMTLAQQNRPIVSDEQNVVDVEVKQLDLKRPRIFSKTS